LKRQKVITIIGARPQFVKAAVVSRAFGKHTDEFEELIVHTGQHFDANMSQVFFDELDIPSPHHHLGVGGGTHGQNTGRMLEKIEHVLIAEKPDWVLVYGDTDSTLAGALAAAKLHIPLAHVEAGLRSFNKRMPEEVNRILTDHASDLLLTPTHTATQNLQREGIEVRKISQVGDVMYDAAIYYSKKAEQTSTANGSFSKTFVLATLHRAENVDDRKRLTSILKGFEDSALEILWPLHPRTRNMLKNFEIKLPANIRLIDPVGYLEMVTLEKKATVIATDSGGVQKEAYFHKVPCVTLRDETEWVELIEAGANTLVGADAAKISRALTDAIALTDDKFERPLYGDGNAGEKIVKSLRR
jgi:UDP-GlcNAc3NAcA epimerase